MRPFRIRGLKAESIRTPTLADPAVGGVSLGSARPGVANTDTSGYHETITVASLRIARAWLIERPDMPLHGALAELLMSPLGRSDWPLAYWSRERLFSVAARRAWVDPDLRAFTL